MNDIRKFAIVLGETTEKIIRTLFDYRILQESNDSSLNSASRALKMQDLRSQIIGFVKRQPNSIFKIVSPEYKSEQKISIKFSNFTYDEVDVDNLPSEYDIIINENFVEATIVHKIKVGKDITLKIKAST
jgi:hypothetical protein